MFGPVPSDNIYLSPSSLVLGNREWFADTVNNSSGKRQFMQAMVCKDLNTLSANVTRTVFNQKITEKYTSDDWAGPSFTSTETH